MSAAPRSRAVAVPRTTPPILLRSPPTLDQRQRESGWFAKHHASAVIYRPPGVHGPSRDVTRSLTRLASSPLSSVAAPGDGNAPQALIQDVADAIAFLALHPFDPPGVVHHPASGLTTAELLRLLGDGREPRHVPAAVARLVLGAGRAAGRLSGSAAAHVRRLEVLWCGQAQAASWLTSHGWQPSTTADDWRRLGRLARDPALLSTTHPSTIGSSHDTPTSDVALLGSPHHHHRRHRLVRVDDGSPSAWLATWRASTS